MGQKLEPDELELYRRADEVLHYLWDPIGIAGTPEARDEYDKYLAHVYVLLTQNKSADVIREYLLGVEQNRMNMGGTKDSLVRLDRAIKSLFRWRKFISERKLTPSS